LNYENKIIKGDCLKVLRKIDSETIDLIYLDPPFFSQKKHKLKNRNNKKYEFSDKWDSLSDYLNLMKSALKECNRVLKRTGSVFLHCDKTASHHLRVLLDDVFGKSNFQNEIIWNYKRWSNSKKGLQNSHQNIYFYSKSNEFKFNKIFTPYSPTTNIDQILQKRERDKDGKSIYKRDEKGNVVLGKEKKGVPLSDVWSIPYLNPKAKERVGYPTQKPVTLLQQIIKIATDEGDIVLDPFCGSGTTCVASKSLNRHYLGIDKSCEAVELAKKRLEDMVISKSNLMKNGKASYQKKSKEETVLLESINAVPVQRNKGIDGFLKKNINGKLVPVKIQSKTELLDEAIDKLEKASLNKDFPIKIVIQTSKDNFKRLFELKTDVKIIKSTKLLLDNLLSDKGKGI